jgi:hypothetical protein
MVVHLCDDDVPVCAIILEVQLSEDERKPFVWPAYVANLRARLKCPVSLLVVTPHENVAVLVSRLLVIRFGALDPEAQGRIRRATPNELEVIGDRLLIAQSLEEALG